jgi:hypothetical protein
MIRQAQILSSQSCILKSAHMTGYLWIGRHLPLVSVSSTQAVSTDRSGLGRGTAPFGPLPASIAGLRICCTARGRGDRVGFDGTTRVGSSLNARLSNCQSDRRLVLTEGKGAAMHTVIVVIIVINFGQLFKVDLVAEQSTNSTKTLDELVTLTGSV